MMNIGMDSLYPLYRSFGGTYEEGERISDRVFVW